MSTVATTVSRKSTLSQGQTISQSQVLTFATILLTRESCNVTPLTGSAPEAQID